MIEVSNCVVCNGAIQPLKRALVAPFVAKRIWNRTPFCVDLVECESCGLRFYNPRLDDDDLGRLYAGYHSREYQEMRHAFEPWYTPKFNADLFSASSYIDRRAKLSPILRKVVGQRNIRRILDYGGDRGDLVVNLLDGAEAFVYDISGAEPTKGAIATANPAECKPDLTINSNVLEHVGFPKQVVSKMLEIAPQGSLVFLEVPLESPFGAKRIARRVAQIAVSAITRPALVRHIANPASLYMMHEHINYFSEKPLAVLMQVSGGTVIAAGTYSSTSRAGDGMLAWCLGSKT
jgi:hypothetical protein